MNTTSTISSSTLNATPRSRSTRRVATIGALAATFANVALWLGGRAADVDFRVSPLVGPQVMQVGVVSVVLTTLLAFAAGWTVLTLAARRSRHRVHVVMAAAAVIAVVSTAGPLSTALDAATGVLLAAMHLITGAAFLAAAATVRAR
jgi:Family of unknown function (DUF6069)